MNAIVATGDHGAQPSSAGELTGSPNTLPAWSMLDAGQLPVEELAAFAERESRRPRPIYLAHKWFARRFGTAFRGLLVGVSTPVDGDFWSGYYNQTNLTGLHVLDPFVGGGTSAVEALRLGANVIGIDVDPVACAVTRFELAAAAMPLPDKLATHLAEDVGARMAPFYRTVGPDGEELVALHYFWVQVVECGGCGRQVDAHPHYQLGYEVAGKRQWVVCRSCGQVAECPRSTKTLVCGECASRTIIGAGPVSYGKLICPSCGTGQRLIQIGRARGRPPTWRLFAVEAISPASGTRAVPLAQRRYLAASEVDLQVFAEARAALQQRRSRKGEVAGLPPAEIPRTGRADSRLLDYGYRRYTDLFNDRQLLHLSLLAEAIGGLGGPERELCALAFSNHLTTNCMQTAYAFGWRRLTPLFSVRAFRHIPRPVELNPWSVGTGRGSYPNALRRVGQAIRYARNPQELTSGGFCATPSRRPAIAPRVLHADARRLAAIPTASVDLVLTDPPYFDNIAYSELSDFFVPWLAMLGAIGTDGPDARAGDLAATSRQPGDGERFAVELGACFSEVSRVLRPGGRLVFTFQHSTSSAWLALAHAVAVAPLVPVQVLPLLGDGTVGLHVHEGASTWDAVFVFKRRVEAHDQRRPCLMGANHIEAALAHAAAWETRLAERLPGRFGLADRTNFRRACLVAASLGFLEPSTGSPVSLSKVLATIDRDAAAVAASD
jgi:putative DNA methylase